MTGVVVDSIFHERLVKDCTMVGGFGPGELADSGVACLARGGLMFGGFYATRS